MVLNIKFVSKNRGAAPLTEIKIKLIKKKGMKVPVQKLSFLIFGLNQKGR
jgi:uncharacterized membrane protein